MPSPIDDTVKIANNLLDDLVYICLYFGMLGLTLGFAIARCCGVHDKIFMHAAHVFVAILIGLAIYRKNRLWAYLAIGLSAVEIVMATITHWDKIQKLLG